MVLDVARQSENFRCMAEWAAGVCERETARCMADLPYRAYVVVDITLLARDSGSIKNKVGRIAPFKHASTARVSICMRHFFHRKAVDKPACSAGCQCSMMHETALASASSTKHSSLSSLPSTPPPRPRWHPTSFRRIPLGVVPLQTFIRRPCQRAISPRRHLVFQRA